MKPRSSRGYRALPGRPDLEWEVSSPSLEDVFIDLMTQARDNFQ